MSVAANLFLDDRPTIEHVIDTVRALFRARIALNAVVARRLRLLYC